MVVLSCYGDLSTGADIESVCDGVAPINLQVIMNRGGGGAIGWCAMIIYLKRVPFLVLEGLTGMRSFVEFSLPRSDYHIHIWYSVW